MPRSSLISVCVFSIGLASVACEQEDDAPPPLLGCTELGSDWLALPNVFITTSEEVAASAESPMGPALPAHCRVVGEVDRRQGSDGKPYAIGFELRLPSEGYRQGFFFQGGAGTDGVIIPAVGNLLHTTATNALSQGYAVASTDGGHVAAALLDPSFGLDPQARLDYGYNAVGRVTGVAKSLIESFYGRAPEHSYFVGCSNGGRQALVAAARWGAEFDGIIASDPGMNLPKATLAQAWDTQQLIRAAAPGQLPRDAFPAATLVTLARRILARCDDRDGLADGIVHDSDGCQQAFDLDRDVPACAEPGAPDCLDAAQKTALAAVFAGVRDSSGAGLYAQWPWDPGLVGADWRFWKLDAGIAPVPFNVLIGAGALGFVFTTPPDQPDLADGGLGYQLALDFDAGSAKIFATSGEYTQSAMEFMTPPHPTELEDFERSDGKLIVVHGTADPVFSSADTVAWYRSLLAANPDARSYARLFLVPGMNHCDGGPATDRFDPLAALEAWVEQGAAPESLIATVDPVSPDVAAQGWPATRSRPLCAYPAHAVLNADAGDTEIASAFHCE